jgi:hypothetical protein
MDRPTYCHALKDDPPPIIVVSILKMKSNETLDKCNQLQKNWCNMKYV